MKKKKIILVVLLALIMLGCAAKWAIELYETYKDYIHIRNVMCYSYFDCFFWRSHAELCLLMVLFVLGVWALFCLLEVFVVKMVKKQIDLKCILKCMALTIAWLTISPLLLILDGRWKLLPKWLRIVLFMLSPMMLILYVVLLLLAHVYYPEYRLRHHFIRPKVVENITGVEMPKYKLVEQYYGPRIGHEYLHECSSILEFKEKPDSTFYQSLPNHGFIYHDGSYYFRQTLGNTLEYEFVPKGKDPTYGYTVIVGEGGKSLSIIVCEMNYAHDWLNEVLP